MPRQGGLEPNEETLSLDTCKTHNADIIMLYLVSILIKGQIDTIKTGVSLWEQGAVH